MLPTEYLPFLITSHSTEFASYCPIKGNQPYSKLFHKQQLFLLRREVCFDNFNRNCHVSDRNYPGVEDLAIFKWRIISSKKKTQFGDSENYICIIGNMTQSVQLSTFLLQPSQMPRSPRESSI